MDDQREHYGDPAPAWAADPGPDPTGLRPCDRAHLAGWIGVFIAFILLGIGIGCVRVLPEHPTTGDLMPLVPLAAMVVAYACAGTCLIFRSLTDRTPTGALVLVCNAMVVGPVLIPGVTILLGLMPGTVAGMIAALPGFRSVAVYVFVAFFAVFAVAEAMILWCNGYGRRVLRFLRAWLDPTGGQWW